METEEFRRRLLEQRRQVLRRVERVEGGLLDLQDATQPEMEERAQEDLEEHVLLSLDERSREELLAIDAALRRLAEGRYFICEVCGGRMSEARLRAAPTATTHVKHGSGRGRRAG